MSNQEINTITLTNGKMYPVNGAHEVSEKCLPGLPIGGIAYEMKNTQAIYLTNFIPCGN